MEENISDIDINEVGKCENNYTKKKENMKPS